MKVEFDLSNHATKVDLWSAKNIDISKFAKIVYLANLNSDVHKLYIDKLKNLPTSLKTFEK